MTIGMSKTWTICIILAFSFLSGCHPASSSVRQKGKETAQLRDSVESLGLSPSADLQESIRTLHKTPRQSVKLLVEELKEINPDPEKGDTESVHVIWCIRGLRSITGQRFAFRSGEQLTKFQKEFFRQDKPLPFVALRMSNSRFYVAPGDVQKKVISAWKEWTKRNLNTFEPKKFQPSGKWYW